MGSLTALSIIFVVDEEGNGWTYNYEATHMNMSTISVTRRHPDAGNFAKEWYLILEVNFILKLCYFITT